MTYLQQLWAVALSRMGRWFAPDEPVSLPEEPSRSVIPHWQRRRMSQNAHTATQAVVQAGF